jgi:predicted PurR-regulated permease PerM
VAAAVLAVGVLLYVLRSVLTPVFFAFLIAYCLDPVVDRLERWRIPRGAGIGLLLTLVLGALALFILLVVPGVVRELVDFARTLPDRAGELLGRIEPWLAERGIRVPRTVPQALDRLELGGTFGAGDVAAPVGKVLGWLVGGTASALGAIAGLLMVPVFAAYLLYDFDRMMEGARELIPHGVRPSVLSIAREIDEVIGQFLRGQLILMFVIAVLFAIAYSLLQVPLAIPIAVVAGVLWFIPYVGGAVALGLALLTCLLDWQGWWQLLGVVGVYAAIQLVEGFFIQPQIVGEKVGLPAVWVLFALMVGGNLFGFMGVLLAVPVAAVAKIFVRRALRWYRSSSLFQGTAAPEESSSPSGGDPEAQTGTRE